MKEAITSLNFKSIQVVYGMAGMYNENNNYINNDYNCIQGVEKLTISRSS